MNYKAYLNSAHWNRTKRIVKEKRGGVCYICYSDEKIHIHHNRYIDSNGSVLGREKVSYLFPLCSRCHGLFHKNYGTRRQTSTFYIRARNLYHLGYSREESLKFSFNSNLYKIAKSEKTDDYSFRPGDCFIFKERTSLKIKGRNFRFKNNKFYYIDWDYNPKRSDKLLISSCQNNT